MWLVDPKIMCRQHTLGEHNELHAFVGTIKKGISLKGYIEKELLESSSIQNRHDELVEEMKARGWNHKSPLVYEDKLNVGKIDRDKSLDILLSRCKECRNRSTTSK